MIRAYKNCFIDFESGEDDRKKHPLHRGKYKLQEALDTFIRCHAEIGSIRELINNKYTAQYLRCCTPQDKHIWLKSLPSMVAFTLGYEVLPALKALVRDGASIGDISNAYRQARKDSLKLVPRLEVARQALHKSISVEYTEMRLGGSLLEPLLAEAIQIAELGLSIQTGKQIVIITKRIRITTGVPK